MVRLQRRIAILLALCLLLSTAAMAEMKRGDSGDMVTQVQQHLRDGGFLSAEPDGRFGRQTEEAVIAFQEVFDYEPNGILDEEQIHHILYGAEEELPDEFYTDGAAADGRGVENYCYSEMRSDGYSYKTTTTYCDAHSWIVAPAEASLQNGEAEDAATMYEEAVMELYTQLWAQMPDSDAGDYIKSAISSMNLMVSGQMELLEKWYGDADPQLLQEKRAELFRSQLVFLCGIVHRDD